jgi:hypothetical protein
MNLRFTYCQECKNWVQALKDLEHIYPRLNQQEVARRLQNAE